MYFYFMEYYIIIPYIFALINFWVLFFKINNFSLAKNNSTTDVLRKKNMFKVVDVNLLIFILNIYLIFMTLNFYSIKGVSITFWWQHLNINNNLNLIISVVFYITFFMSFILLYLSTTTSAINYNFLFSICNIALLINIIFFSNTFFTFFFIIELTSLLVLLKLASSKFFNSHNLLISKNIFYKKNIYNIFIKSYSNMLFFTYWTTFFSSILFVYIIINYIYTYNTTEWFLINFYIKNTVQIKNTSAFQYIFIAVLILIAFFLKTGLTPFHLYKIELYKGIPYITIFFYNTFYFFFYFLIFIYFIFLYLNEYYILTFNYIVYILFISTLYIVSFLFNINYIKSFFAYSTILNSILFLLLIFAFINI